MERAAKALAELPPEATSEWLERFTVVQLAALRHDWSMWARPKQWIDREGPWRSMGFLTGRGFGKTRTISEYLNREVARGDARRIALLAQNEDKTFEVMVDGPSGLIATAPPKKRPRWERSRLLWPNGAEAFVFTPEVPGSLRGPEHDHAWVSEIVAWPAAQRDETFSNLRFGLRKRAGRLLWDTTPKRRNPLIRYLLERSRKYPQTHVVIRGSMRENIANLAPEVVSELEEEYGGTQRGQEELEGIFFDEAEGALWKDEWFQRRRAPDRLTRRVIAVDPAISVRAGTDPTGIIEAGLDSDGHAIVLDDMSERHEWDAWADIVVTRYVEGRCDLVVVERNRGGDACAGNIRRACKDRGLTCIIVGDKARPTHSPGTVNVREVISRRSKEARAEPVAGRYQRGKVSHVAGLDALEDELTTWDPESRGESPNRLDACVMAICELLGLVDERRDGRAGFAGVVAANAKLQMATSRGSLSAVRRGRTI